jgi:dCTP diphosphatase
VTEHLLDPAAFARLADEVADVMIYLVRFADVSGIDILSAVRDKMERNETRLPTVPG